MSSHNVEQDLNALSETYPFPATPDIAVGVRLEPRRTNKRLRYSIASALIALLCLSLIPPGQDAIADVLGVVGIDLRPGSEEDAPPRVDTFVPELFGHPITMDDAQAAFPVPLVLPSSDILGDPAEAYLYNSGSSDDLISVTVVYAPTDRLPEISDSGVGALFTQVVAPPSKPYLLKTFFPVNVVEVISIDGDTGFWVEDGAVSLAEDPEVSRPSANVLVWSDNMRIGYRLESNLDQPLSISVAESLQPMSLGNRLPVPFVWGGNGSQREGVWK